MCHIVLYAFLLSRGTPANQRWWWWWYGWAPQQCAASGVVQHRACAYGTSSGTGVSASKANGAAECRVSAWAWAYACSQVACHLASVAALIMALTHSVAMIAACHPPEGMHACGIMCTALRTHPSTPVRGSDYRIAHTSCACSSTGAAFVMPLIIW